MVRKSIFKPCELEYKEHDLPVRFSEEFLKEIASNTPSTVLVNEHYGGVIGDITNFTFTDGELFADINSSHSLQKFSPSFDGLTLEKHDDYLLATGGRLVEVSSTDKPRLDNSDDGGTRMGESDDKTKEFLATEIDRLQKELAKKDLQIERNKEKLDKFDDMENEITELRTWKETNEKVIEEQKPIIEAYKKEQEQHRTDLLEKVSKGNPQLKEQFESFSTENLETYLKLHSEEQPPKGAGANNAPGLNEGDNSKDKEEAEQQARNEAVENMFGELFEKEE